MESFLANWNFCQVQTLAFLSELLFSPNSMGNSTMFLLKLHLEQIMVLPLVERSVVFMSSHFSMTKQKIIRDRDELRLTIHSVRVECQSATQRHS